jgi:Fe-S-cluster containining protein
MSSIENVLDKYNELGTYCENFWQGVSKKFAKDIACHEGCGICCELQSVNLLEAYSITRSLPADYIPPENVCDDKCAFLCNDVCTIYASRPLICRTHGLIIKSVEFTSDYSITCPYNFNECNNEICSEAILDIDRITENMMKLNYAFCMITDLLHLASERILLADIANRKFALPVETHSRTSLPT